MTPTVVSAPAEVPVVAVDPHTGPAGMPTVDADNVGGAVAATEHLLALGHRRIALLGGREDLESARLREHGFRAAMAAAGVPVDPDLVRVGGYRPETASAPARELLSRPDRPTAVFAANDISAIRTIEVAARARAARARGPVRRRLRQRPRVRAVQPEPDDDRAAAARHRAPPPCGCSSSCSRGGSPTPAHVRLPTAMVTRDSTGPVPAS